MRDDEKGLIVCSKEDAKYLISNEPDIADSLVITSVLPVGELIVIPEEEFLDYLHERNEFSFLREEKDEG